MNLPPLPLINGCLHIDNSTLELFTECWAKGRWNKLHNKIRSGGNAPLDFGSAIHLVLDHRYSTCKDKPVSSEVFQQQTDILTQFFAEHPVDEFEHRNLNHAIEITKRYNLKYQVEPFNVLLGECSKCKGTGIFLWEGQVYMKPGMCDKCKGTGKAVLAEVAFAIPLYTATCKNQLIPIIFCGKIDLPVSWNGKIVIMDDKTDSLFFGPQKAIDEQMVSNQPLGYAFAFEKTTGCTVEGFAINIIPTKEPPARPRDGIDAWWNSQFIRDLKFLATTPNWRQDWLDSTISQIDSFLWHYEREQFPMTGKFLRACTKYGGCPYLDICNSVSEEKKIELLETDLYKTNTWSPLKQQHELIK